MPPEAEEFHVTTSPVETELGEAVHETASFGMTVTCVEHVAVPPGPVTVPAYVVLLDGETSFEPLATGVTAPTPLSIENDEPFVVVHDKVDALPATIEVGLAESVQVGGGGVTFTVAEQVVCPPEPETVMVYSVVLVSETCFVPASTGETLPTP